MELTIKTNSSLSPEQTEITINDVKYKEFTGLKLTIAKDKNGELIISHENGFLEVYKGE